MAEDGLAPAARYRGAALGAFIGDALAMPAHWYYDTEALWRQFGRIDSYRRPPREHPNSILWRSVYEPAEPEYDILGDQRRYWGRRRVHYHQFLEAGENTLNLKLLGLALDLIVRDGGYDRTRYVEAYRRFMLCPGEHRDTYVEECHRGFFVNLSRAIPPDRAAVQEKHIGGMVAVVPLYTSLRSLGHDHDHAAAGVLEHVSVTHAGRRVRDAAISLLTVASELIDGVGLAESLRGHLRRQDLPFLLGPIESESSEPVPRILGRRYSTACYLDDAMPATFYLALRYAEDPSEGLVENTMAGGDNCHRGAVLGALFGTAYGASAFPEAWREGLCASLPTSGTAGAADLSAE